MICKDSTGLKYRVSSIEYAKGDHNHVCNGRMMIRTPDGEVKSIFVSDYNPEIHKTQFKDYVMVHDKVSGRNKRISNNEFVENLDRYSGITSGIVMARDKAGNIVRVSQKEFDNRGDLDGLTVGKIPVTCRVTGNKLIIEKLAYDRKLHHHANEGKIVVFDIIEGRTIKIDREKYDTERHSNSIVKLFPLWRGKIYTSKDLFRVQYRRDTGKNINEKMKIGCYRDFDSSIDVISKQELVERINNDKN